MHVEFAPPGKEADDVIEDLIAGHSAPKRLLVVSSDHRLHKAARRRKAKVRDSDKFLDACESAAQRVSQVEEPLKERHSAKLSPEEVAAWAAEFGDVDVTDLRAAPRGASGMGPAPPQSSQGTQPQSAPGANPDELEFWKKRLADLLSEPLGGKSAK
jgi:hypothetical protein